MRMPVVFTAHGNPMNALGGTPFAAFLGEWGRRLPPPRAILAISAHYETPGLTVTSSAAPPTIHDFGGFPPALYAIRYPAPGDPALAARVAELLAMSGLPSSSDPERGLDHGVWAPLRFLYPESDVPIVELSLSIRTPLGAGVEVGRAIAPLRDERVLVLGSGNLVHNLRTADLGRRDGEPEPWAVAFDTFVAQRLLDWDLAALAAIDRVPEGRKAHPTLEHFAPLLVVCGAADAGGEHPAVTFPFEGFEHRTLSLRCVEIA